MERSIKRFSYTDMEKLSAAMLEHGAMVQQVGEMKSFPLELAMIASVLRENNMPQETINMVLAARCGLPMQKIDPKSPCFVWVDDEPVVQQ